jgi:hypothetical protein
MTADEMIFALGHQNEVKRALFRQLHSIEDIDPDLAGKVKIKLDQICGLQEAIDRLPPQHKVAIAGCQNRTSGITIDELPAAEKKAIKALQKMINAIDWDLSSFQAWREEAGP